MTDYLKSDKDFKEAIGAFMIAFSELEYGLVFLCTMTEFDLRQKDKYFIKYLGFSFEKKVIHLTEFIEEQLEEVKPIWEKLLPEIKALNKERRFFAHGFMNYVLPRETITTHVKNGKGVSTKQHTVSDIKGYVNRLQHLNTGDNGINGEFHTLFTKTRVNKWNELVNDDAKIVYTVNSSVVSDWKGK